MITDYQQQIFLNIKTITSCRKSATCYLRKDLLGKDKEVIRYLVRKGYLSAEKINNDIELKVI